MLFRGVKAEIEIYASSEGGLGVAGCVAEKIRQELKT
jgi:hypothetical protein